MSKVSALQRLRQLHAIDMNAVDIYKDLSESVSDPELKRNIESILADERRHVALEEKIISILTHINAE